MTEAEKKKFLAIQAELNTLSTSRKDALFSGADKAIQTSIDHMNTVQETYKGMSRAGYTVDDLIAAYNRGSQQAFDFAISFFYSAYAIALKEMDRDVEETLNKTTLPENTVTVPLRCDFSCSGNAIQRKISEGRFMLKSLIHERKLLSLDW